MRVAIIALVSIIALGSLTAAYGGDSGTELHPGWNLVAWTGETTHGVQAAYGWNPTTQLFDRYFPDRPDASTLTQLEEGQTYWILMEVGGFLSIEVEDPDPRCPEAPACPTAIPCPDSTPCPTATACPTPTPYPTAAACPTAAWTVCCAEIREVGSLLEGELMACELFDLACENEKQQLAILNAFLEEMCE